MLLADKAFLTRTNGFHKMTLTVTRSTNNVTNKGFLFKLPAIDRHSSQRSFCYASPPEWLPAPSYWPPSCVRGRRADPLSSPLIVLLGPPLPDGQTLNAFKLCLSPDRAPGSASAGWSDAEHVQAVPSTLTALLGPPLPDGQTLNAFKLCLPP